MNAIDVRYRSAQRHLDALEQDAAEEPWKAAHQEAERCHGFGRILDLMVNEFEGIRQTDRLWREAVYRAITPPDAAVDARSRDFFRRWLRLADSMHGTLDGYERSGHAVDNADEFRRCRQAAATLLAGWAPPLPSASPAMHVEDVSEEEADALRRLLQAPAGSPGKLKVKPLAARS